MANIEIDGNTYEIGDCKTILEVAKANNLDIPTLCYSQALEEYGACRLCVVEVIRGERSELVTSCTVRASEGIKVYTNNEKVRKNRRMSIELLLSRCPDEEKLKELAREYDIEKVRFSEKDDNCILCGLCVRMCERIGRQAISFQNRGIERELGTPYMEHSDVCITCGACAFICPTTRFTKTKVERVSGNAPVEIPSEFDEGTVSRHPIYFPFPQAVPKIPTIDRTKCVYFNTGHCQTCFEYCEAGAIDYDQEEVTYDLDIGSVVVTTGYDLIDPGFRKEYGYENIPNVVTAMEFERYLSASGPTEGHLVRPSDHRTPKKIAFIQCYGSRDEHFGCSYCSRVCCMYAIKEAMLIKDHEKDIDDITIFFMDIRAFGKGFEQYYNRAKNEIGVNFSRSRPSRLVEDPETGDVIIHTEDTETGELVQHRADLVILSSGMVPSKGTDKLAQILDVELNDGGFFKEGITDAEPMSTTRPGIYAAGCSSGPKDIPDTVAQASGAAASAGVWLKDHRAAPEKKEVEPIDSSGRARIGVFVCHCGVNISGVINVPSVADFAKTLPYVEYADDSIYTCSETTQKDIQDIVIENKLNRVVIASCSPRTHEPIFRQMLEEIGLNPYLFEMVNIRDQGSWVHKDNPDEATEKSKNLIAAAVAKARMLKPLEASELPVNHDAMVIGGGVSGMTSAISLAELGFHVNLIEKSGELGGALLTKDTLAPDNKKASDLIADLKAQIDKLDIKTFMNTEISGLHGFVGNFNATITNSMDSQSTELDLGAIILAIGSDLYKPEKGEFGYGEHSNVITNQELEEIMLKSGDGSLAVNGRELKRVAFIHCVGSRDEDGFKDCSRYCCQVTLKQANELRDKGIEVVEYNRDIRAFSKGAEKLYRTVREKGGLFIRYDPDNRPEVRSDGDGITISAYDAMAGMTVELPFDAVVLAVGMRAYADDVKYLRDLMKVPKGADGFFLESHPKLGPVETNTSGIFLGGCAQFPKDVVDSIAQAKGAAAGAATVLSKDKLLGVAMIARVQEELCIGCETCIEVCPYNAIEKVDGHAHVLEAVCKGCGSCATACRNSAIQQKGFRDEYIITMIDNALEEVE